MTNKDNSIDDKLHLKYGGVPVRPFHIRDMNIPYVSQRIKKKIPAFGTTITLPDGNSRRHTPIMGMNPLPCINEHNNTIVLPMKEIDGNLYRNYDITSAMVSISNACPLDCVYCFEKDMHDSKLKMSIETVDATFFYLYHNAKRNKTELSITLFGGEPTTNLDAIERFFHLACEYGHEISIQMSIITNGFIMNDRLYDLLYNFVVVAGMPFTVQISMDGIPEVQNANRPTIGGGESSATVVKNIGIYKEIFTKAGRVQDIVIHSVTSPTGAYKLHETYKYITETFGLNLWTCPVQDDGLSWTDADVEAFTENYARILEDAKQDKLDANKIMHNPLNGDCKTNAQLGHACGAGLGYAGIMPDGDIWTCHHYYYNQNQPDYQDYNVGNVYDGVDPFAKGLMPFRRVSIGSDDQPCGLSDNCIGCDNGLCYRCHAANHAATGNPKNQIVNTYCRLMNIIHKFVKDMKSYTDNIDRLEYEKVSNSNPLSEGNIINTLKTIMDKVTDNENIILELNKLKNKE